MTPRTAAQDPPTPPQGSGDEPGCFQPPNFCTPPIGWATALAPLGMGRGKKYLLFPLVTGRSPPVGSLERAVVKTLLTQLRSLLLFREQQRGVGGSGPRASSSRSLPGPDISVNVRKILQLSSF